MSNLSAVGLSTISAPCRDRQFPECLAVGAAQWGDRRILSPMRLSHATSIKSHCRCYLRMPPPVVAVEQAAGQGSAQHLCCAQSEPGIGNKRGRVTVPSPGKKFPLGRKAYYPRARPS